MALAGTWKSLAILTLLVCGAVIDDRLWAHARSSGQGVNGACPQMTPFHTGLVPKTTPPSYTVSFQPQSYTVGQPVTVTIRGCGSSQFKGFMAQARRATVGTVQTERLGSFNPVSGTRKVCDDNAGLIHSNSVEKTTLTFEWVPPASSQGPVQFWVTFVKNYGEVWAATKSEVLLDSQISGTPDPSTLTPSTTRDAACDAPPVTSDPGTATDPPTQAGKVTAPAGCGTSLGCISKCEGSSCETVVSWLENGDNVRYTLSSVVGSSKAFMAMGLSSDAKMGGDSLIGCVHDGGNAVVYSGKTSGQSAPTPFVDNEIKLVSFTFSDNVLTCTIERPKAASANGDRFDTTQKWNILFARGSGSISGQTPSISYHAENKFPSSGKYSSSDKPAEGVKDVTYPMIKAHGSAMIVSWIFFAGIGVIVARYYKPVWVNDLCSQKVWFQIHRLCMMLVFGGTVAGFVIIFVEVEEWSELIEKDEYLEYHPHLGCIVTGLTLLNPLMALIRPHPGTKNRPIFNWAHWFVGTCAHILGVITIFFGVQLQKAQVPDYMVYILAGYAAWQVGVAFVLEIAQCLGRSKAREELYEMDDLQNQTSKASNHEAAETINFKRGVLILHFCVLGAITAVLVSFVILGEDEL